MKSTALLIWLAAALGLLATTESNSDEQGHEATPPKPDASDRFIGKEAGDVRDDNGLRMKLVWCPPGKFEMDDRSDAEEGVIVELTDGYWLGKCEVTQSEWKQVMGGRPWKNIDENFTKDGDDFPATSVTWGDAQDFCLKLTEQERKSGRLADGWKYALPTEAQWERACRAGTETTFSFGDDDSNLDQYAWFLDNTEKAGEEHAHRIGQKKPNSWGLHDMHGNVWEWCSDWYHDIPPGGRDPEVKKGSRPELETKSSPVFRGGSWRDTAWDCRSGYRHPWVRSLANDSVGFRVALSTDRNSKTVAPTAADK